MKAEDHIRNLNQIPPISKEEKGKKLRTSIVLTLSTVVSILFLMYGFMQKQEADRLKMDVVKFQKIAMDAQTMGEQQRLAAMAAQQEAEAQRIIAIQALTECNKTKK
jgi:hypothetical protein